MKKQKAIFAGGCFWGVQDYFDQVPGVIETKVGYSGGFIEDPTYEEVCSSKTGHAEAILIEFDSDLVSYKTLLKHFFKIHDPTQYMRQGPDIGPQYRSAIFFLNQSQQEDAEVVKDEVQKDYSKDIVTEITPAQEFYEAEEYHQKFTKKTGRGACHVKYSEIN